MIPLHWRTNDRLDFRGQVCRVEKVYETHLDVVTRSGLRLTVPREQCELLPLPPECHEFLGRP